MPNSPLFSPLFSHKPPPVLGSSPDTFSHSTRVTRDTLMCRSTAHIPQSRATTTFTYPELISFYNHFPLINYIHCYRSFPGSSPDPPAALVITAGPMNSSNQSVSNPSSFGTSATSSDSIISISTPAISFLGYISPSTLS